jgi:hypothetical protein
MNFEAFYEAVNNMVKEWQPDDPQAGATPREGLRSLYNEVCEQAVYDIAQRACRTLHKHYTTPRDETKTTRAQHRARKKKNDATTSH